MALRVGFVGGGKMGEAMFAAMLKTGTVLPENLIVAEVNPERRAALLETHGVRVVADSLELPDAADVVFLSVKPQSLDQALEALGPRLSEDHLVVSIAAGKPLAYFASRIRSRRLVRLMPNLPALVGEGVTAFCLGTEVSSTDRHTIMALLACFGRVVELEERLFDAQTALAGSGPAFFAYLAAKMAEGGVKLGLDPDVAMLGAQQTMLGTAKLLLTGVLSPMALIDAVSSKEGTTVAGFRVLGPSDVGEVLAETLAAAAERSHELSG